MSTIFPGPDAVAVFALASAVLSIAAYVPYIRDTYSGATQPQRASWLIWSVLSSIAFVAQVYEGATASLWFAGAQVLGTVTVFLLSITRGSGVYLTRPDERVLWIAAMGLVVWYFTETAVYALALVITISLLGGTLTIAKAYRAPETETMGMWVISLVAATLALMTVPTWDPVLLAYPAYLFTLYAAISVAMVMGRARQSTPFAPG